MSKLKNIREANVRLESRMLFENTSSKNEYSVQKIPNTNRFRIFVKNAKFPTPTDAEKVFGKMNNWKDYSTQSEAENIIKKIVELEKKGPKNTDKYGDVPKSDYGDVPQAPIPQSTYGDISTLQNPSNVMEESEIRKIKSIMGI